MNKLIFLVLIIFGLTLITWAVSLIHHSYVNELELLHLIKTEAADLPVELKEHNSEQAAKSVFVHVGLIIFGTSMATYALFKKSNI